MSDLPDFLGGEPSDLGEAPVIEAIEPALAAPEAPITPPEPAAPEAPVAPVEQAQIEPQAPPPGHVPLTALLDTRDQLREARERIRAFEAQQQPVESPDPFEDPEGYAAHQQASFEQALKVNTFNTSKLIAESGPDAALVPQALQWAHQRAEADPGFRHQSFNHPNPVGFALQEFKRQQTLTQVGDDPDAFVRRRAAELGFVQPNPQPANPAPQAPQPVAPQRPSAPRPSLASAPSAGSVAAPQVRNGEQTFDAMFTR